LSVDAVDRVKARKHLLADIRPNVGANSGAFPYGYGLMELAYWTIILLGVSGLSLGLILGSRGVAEPEHGGCNNHGLPLRVRPCHTEIGGFGRASSTTGVLWPCHLNRHEAPAF